MWGSGGDIAVTVFFLFFFLFFFFWPTGMSKINLH